MLHGREVVRSEAGFLVLWLGKGKTLPIWGSNFVGVWPAAQGRRCLLGDGFLGVVLGERGKCCTCRSGVDWGVGCCTNWRLSVRGLVPCSRGW